MLFIFFALISTERIVVSPLYISCCCCCYFCFHQFVFLSVFVVVTIIIFNFSHIIFTLKWSQRCCCWCCCRCCVDVFPCFFRCVSFVCSSILTFTRWYFKFIVYPLCKCSCYSVCVCVCVRSGCVCVLCKDLFILKWSVKSEHIFIKTSICVWVIFWVCTAGCPLRVCVKMCVFKWHGHVERERESVMHYITWQCRQLIADQYQQNREQKKRNENLTRGGITKRNYIWVIDYNHFTILFSTDCRCCRMTTSALVINCHHCFFPFQGTLWSQEQKKLRVYDNVNEWNEGKT